MTREPWGEVDRYLDGLLAPADPVLQSALDSSAAAGMPAIQVSASQGKLLSLLAAAIGARRVLEIGTLGGYSTLWLARALPEGGRVVTLEIDPRHAEVARANCERAGLSRVIEVRVGRAGDSLAQLIAEGAEPFDFIFIDADKPGYAGYWDASLALSRRGTVIIADNVVREGAVADPASQDPNVVGVRRFLERIAAEPRVSATALQMVGAKGWDGWAIARVLG